MTFTTNLSKNTQTKDKKISLYGIISASLLALGITIGLVIFRLFISKDYTFELSDNLPIW